jgi:hypothetical protein
MRKFETVAVCLLEAIFDLETVANARLNNNGAHPLRNGAIRSDADSVPKIIAELAEVRNSERENRVIDHDREGSMELKEAGRLFLMASVADWPDFVVGDVTSLRCSSNLLNPHSRGQSPYFHGSSFTRAVYPPAARVLITRLNLRQATEPQTANGLTHIVYRQWVFSCGRISRDLENQSLTGSRG